MRVLFAAALLLVLAPVHAENLPGPAARSASRAVMAGAKISAHAAPAGSFNADCVAQLDDEGLAAEIDAILIRRLSRRDLASANAYFASPDGQASTAAGVDGLYQQLAPELEHAPGRALTPEQELQADAFGATPAGQALAHLMSDNGPMKPAILPAVQAYFAQCVPQLNDFLGDAQLIK